MIDDTHPILPWYRQLWPWILIAIPASSVVFGFVMLSVALNTNNSLVVDDYYREGKAINVRIARDRRATELGVGATLGTRGDRLELALSVPDAPGTDAFVPPAEIRLRWAHVTQDTRDGETVLRPIGQGRYLGSAADFPDSGRFRLHVEPSGDDWRLVSGVQVLETAGRIAIEPRTVEATVARGAGG